MTESLPLFPLHTVLFPGGLLPLRIFEARYLDMVSTCLRGNIPFGVCLISSGTEAGAPAECVAVGTAAIIEDHSRTPDGLLGVTARGQRRFRVHTRRVASDNLVSADVEWLAEVPSREATAAHLYLHDLYRELCARIGRPAPPANADSAWLSWRLAELLPLDADFRQELLEENDGSLRLGRLHALLKADGRIGEEV